MPKNNIAPTFTKEKMPATHSFEHNLHYWSIFKKVDTLTSQTDH
jgi:hypothetical protein